MSDFTPIPENAPKGVWFRLSPHSMIKVHPGGRRESIEIVEVFYGQQFIAGIYPPQEKDGGKVQIKIVSKHLQNSMYGIYLEVGEPPALVVRFDPLVPQGGEDDHISGGTATSS